MSEREPVDPRFLSPEYWGGHSPEDNCQWRENLGSGIPYTEYRRLGDDGKSTLKGFLTVVDREPIRTFDEGELFEGEQFPEGTIIKCDIEDLSVTKQFWPHQPYKRRDIWGVICGYDVKGTRELVITHHLVSPGGWVSSGLPKESSIRVGATSHTRIKRKNYQSESLTRVNKIWLYNFGQGVREKVQKQKRAQTFGGIFDGNPEPETT